MSTKTNGILAVLLILACVLGLIALNWESTVDFRGTVTNVEREGDVLILTLAHGGATVKVCADGETRVQPCCENDPAVSLSEIRVGDLIEGSLRRNESVAKTITVYYE